MKLKYSLFLFFGGLILILVFFQLWIINNLDQEIRKEMSNTAYEVSKDSFDKIEQEIINTFNAKVVSSNSDGDNADDFRTFILIDDDDRNYIIKSIGPKNDQIIDVSQLNIEHSISEYLSEIIYSMLIILSIGLVIVGYFSHKISTPLQQLTNMASKIADGKFGEEIHIQNASSLVEINTLISSFNSMSLELKKLEKKNRKLQEKRQLTDIGDIARGIAHSLRNPLNTMGLGVEELVTNNPSKERREKIGGIINNQLERIDDWVKKFMMLSHASATNISRINISQLISDLKLELQFIKSDISWSMNLSNDCYMEGVEEELRSILQVVIENALEVSPEKSQILITTTRQNNTCSIIVEDNGHGISDEVKSNLFTPGFTSKQKGFGMGLYIAKSLASNRYDGDIKIINRTINKETIGATVSIVLHNKTTELLAVKEV